MRLIIKNNPHKWKKNIAKKLRNSGVEYKSIKTGKQYRLEKLVPLVQISVGLLAHLNLPKKKEYKFLILTGS